jgi:hypothetical protein
MTYRLGSFIQMLFSLHNVSAVCILASIYVFGVLLLTYRLPSLFQMLLGLPSVGAAYIYASIYAGGPLFI